jgi:hypothetical protein
MPFPFVIALGNGVQSMRAPFVVMFVPIGAVFLAVINFGLGMFSVEGN